jgi:hypothetical protein
VSYVVGIKGTAVFCQDDYFLGNVHQASSQIPAVGGTESRISQSLAGAVCRDEILQRRETLTEAGLNGQINDATAGVAHQPPHAGHLFDLHNVTFSAGQGHHADAAIIA